MEITLSALAGHFISIGKALAPVVRQLRAERQAGADSASVKTALLDGPLEETLSRLHNIEAHDTWWRELLQRAQSEYVRPDYLAKLSIRDWLSEASVRDDMKTLARAMLLPGTVDQDAISARLAERYAHYTGEAVPLATGPIEAIVNILLAGSLARGTKGDLLVAGLIQESHQQVSAHLETIEAKIGELGPDEIVTQTHTEKCRGVLDLILRRRSMPTVDARAEIAVLTERLAGQGDLRFCAKPVQAEVYLWAARLQASAKDKMEAARQYRAKALSIDSAADTKIIDAWLRANSGDVDGALARLREIDTADARSNLFIMLSLHHGRQRALEWLDANGPIDAKFLTALGWKNAATLLAEAGRWEDAAARLEVLPDEIASECPDLPYVEGVINAAMTLPVPIRHFALIMQVFDKQVEILEGAEAAARNHRALRCFDLAKQSLGGIGEKIRAAGAETWRVWLLLTEPPSRPLGERIVVDSMREGATAVDYVQLADSLPPRSRRSSRSTGTRVRRPK